MTKMGGGGTPQPIVYGAPPVQVKPFAYLYEQRPENSIKVHPTPTDVVRAQPVRTDMFRDQPVHTGFWAPTRSLLYGPTPNPTPPPPPPEAPKAKPTRPQNIFDLFGILGAEGRAGIER